MWTFGICTDGIHTEFHDAMIASIRANAGDNRIVFCTENTDFSRETSDITTVYIPTTRPRWITRKKNTIASVAKTENIFLMHDYGEVNPEFTEAMTALKEQWDVCCTQVLHDDGTRYWDWCTKDSPVYGQAVIPYSCQNQKPWQYVSGSFFAVKRGFLLANPLDETRIHGEDEDGEWSLRCRGHWRLSLCVRARVQCLRYGALYLRGGYGT